MSVPKTFFCLVVLASSVGTLSTTLSSHAHAAGQTTPGAPTATLPDPRQPSTPAAPAVIRGRVLRSGDGRPLRRAQVLLLDQPRRNAYSAVTDDSGHFEIRGVAPGAYVLSAQKAGYLPMAFGQSIPGDVGSVVQVRAGEVRERLDLTLPRGGVISGTILDDAGEPLSGARVSVARVRHVDWQPTYSRMASVTSDDLGGFRVYGLPAGVYQIWATTTSSALPLQENRLGYLPTYYPGTGQAGEATTVTVAPGDQLYGLTMSMLPGRSGSLSGTLISAVAEPVENVLVTLTPAPPPGTAGPSAGRTTMSAGGAFSFAGVTPGEYRLSAGSGTLQAMTDVVFTGDVTGDVHSNHVLTLSPGVRVRGRIQFDGTFGLPNAKSVTLTMVALDRQPPGRPTPRVSEDGAFEYSGVHARRILLRATAPGWALARVSVKGFDVTDDPIELDRQDVDDVEIRLAQTVTEVSGTVTDQGGAPLPNATVIIFADDPARWGPGTRFAARASSNAQGQFSVRGLPPASYAAVAIGRLEVGEETNRDRLTAWRRSRATRFDLGAGASRTIQLRGGAP